MESQVDFYLLMEKLNALIDQQKAELDQLKKPEPFTLNSREAYEEFSKECHNYRDAVIAITVKYKQRRDRILWWYQHKGDVYAMGIIFIVVVTGLYFLLA